MNVQIEAPPLAESADLDSLLGKFAAGTAAFADVERLAQILERRKQPRIRIDVHRWSPVPASGQVRLMGKSGPHSREDRSVTSAGDRLVSAWFETIDLRLWVEQNRGRRG
jgi:hypothetical protein